MNLERAPAGTLGYVQLPDVPHWLQFVLQYEAKCPLLAFPVLFCSSDMPGFAYRLRGPKKGLVSHSL